MASRRAHQGDSQRSPRPARGEFVAPSDRSGDQGAGVCRVAADRERPRLPLHRRLRRCEADGRKCSFRSSVHGLDERGARAAHGIEDEVAPSRVRVPVAQPQVGRSPFPVTEPIARARMSSASRPAPSDHARVKSTSAISLRILATVSWCNARSAGWISYPRTSRKVSEVPRILAADRWSPRSTSSPASTTRQSA